jgi:hypothetical protein
MNKLLNYIVNGRGFGAIIILSLSVLLSAYNSIKIRNITINLIPYFQIIADDILPVKIENGKITQPKDLKKSFPLYSGEKIGDLAFTIDTSVDNLDTNNLKAGLYLTKDKFYAVNAFTGNIKSFEFNGDIYLEKKDYTQTLNSNLKWFIIFIAIVFILKYFITYSIITLCCAYLTKTFTKLDDNQLNFKISLRLSSICVSSIILLSFMLSLIGIHLHTYIIFILIATSQYLLVKHIKQS